jgi:hypothetical protein
MGRSVFLVQKIKDFTICPTTQPIVLAASSAVLVLEVSSTTLAVIPCFIKASCTLCALLLSIYLTCLKNENFLVSSEILSQMDTPKFKASLFCLKRKKGGRKLM